MKQVRCAISELADRFQASVSMTTLLKKSI